MHKLLLYGQCSIEIIMCFFSPELHHFPTKLDNHQLGCSHNFIIIIGFTLTLNLNRLSSSGFRIYPIGFIKKLLLLFGFIAQIKQSTDHLSLLVFLVNPNICHHRLTDRSTKMTGFTRISTKEMSTKRAQCPMCNLIHLNYHKKFSKYTK